MSATKQTPTTVKTFDGNEISIAAHQKTLADFPMTYRARMSDDGQAFISGITRANQNGLDLVGNGTLQFPVTVKMTFTDELHNKLVELADQRVQSSPNKLSKKQAMGLQHELFLGAITAIDFMSGEWQKGKDGKTCAPPLIYFSIMRGDLIERIEPDVEG